MIDKQCAELVNFTTGESKRYWIWQSVWRTAILIMTLDKIKLNTTSIIITALCASRCIRPYKSIPLLFQFIHWTR